jgi:hypothetical protein
MCWLDCAGGVAKDRRKLLKILCFRGATINDNTNPFRGRKAVSERTGINWHQGLRLQDLKRRYRRFRDDNIYPFELETKLDELEEQEYHDRWDYDDYWNPWDPAEYLPSYWTYLIQNLDAVKALHSMDPTGVLGQQTAITPFYSPKELPRLLSNHVRSVNDCKDLESVYTFVRNALRGVSRDDAKTLAHTFGYYTSLVSQILLLAPFWVRPLSGWTGDHLSGTNLISSVVDHLFVTYPLPEFLYRIWQPERDQPTSKWIYWFVLLGQGASLHRATEHFTDWAITKSFVQYLLQAPPDLTPLESCMWAEAIRLGGSATEFQRLREHPNYMWDPTDARERDTRWQSFWRDTVRWLTRHREELTDEMCHLILIWSSRRWHEQFTLRNRTPQSAYQAAQRFFEMQERPWDGKWRGHGCDWEFLDQDEDVWSFRELTSGYQLLQEGREMQHCVQSYTERCLTGLDSIFSLSLNARRCLTIQVNLASRRIVQARGLCNRWPTPEEDLVLGAWQREVLDS